MNDETSPSRGPLGEENRPRKGRTIDIEATEIKNADVEPEAPSDAQPAQAAEQMPDLQRICCSGRVRMLLRRLTREGISIGGYS